MQKEQFIVTAKGEKISLRMAVTVESTESCMPSRITAAKNVIFDMLRSQDFDVDKIVFVSECKMPLTKKGTKIKQAMRKHYGKKKGTSVFHASQKKGTIKGTHKGRKK